MSDAEHTTVAELLAAARGRIAPLSPPEAHTAVQAGALLVDIRSDHQRAADGVIPGARYVPRNVLEWRLDPECPHRDPELARRDARIVLFCNEGYQSSLAAATACSFGLDVTDMAGGFQAWRAGGLPVQPA
jgi:rhodanese-related sulfurtransferase